MIGTAFLPDATSVLQTVLAVSVLIAIVLVARKPVARHFGAGVAYALWAIPLVRLILPPLQMPVSIMPLLHLPPAGATAAAAPSVLAIAPASSNAAPVVALTPPAPPVPHSPPLPDVMREGLTSPESLTDMAFAVLLPGLFVLWAGGALVFFSLSLWRQHEFMQTVKREAVAVSPHLQRTAQDVARQVRLKRLPVIASSFISSGPLVTGLVRPVVLLPAWFETDYDDVQQRAALAHEMTHVRRGDLWALQVAELFVACLWFNPLAHYARRAFRTDQEAACDADVLKTGAASPHAYGATLIKAVKSAAQERLPAAASLPLTHALKERLSRMTHPVPTRARRITGFTAASIVGVGALFATASVTANAGEPDKQIRIGGSDGTFTIDGKEVKDRQIVILGEPFADAHLSPEDQAEIDRLSAELAEEGAQIGELVTEIVAQAAIFALTPEDSDELDDVLASLGDMPVFEELPFLISTAVRAEGNMTDEERAAFDAEMEAQTAEFEARMEEWGERFGTRMEAWGEKVGARAEAWAVNFDPEVDVNIDELEARIEAKAETLERLMEDRFGGDFEARIEATSDAISDMAEECRDAEMADGETRVISRSIQTADGSQKVKIACVKGDAAALRSASTLAAIEGNKSLCPVEKQSFRDHVRDESELDGADK